MTNSKEFLSTDGNLKNSSANNDNDMMVNDTKSPQRSQNDLLMDSIEYHYDKKMASLRLMIPTYLDNQLTQIAAGKRITKRYLILKALSEAGYHIEKEDLVADKRRVR